ncbi:hypothetical protein DPMN_036538, partial [Dreissena polymorpha]
MGRLGESLGSTTAFLVLVLVTLSLAQNPCTRNDNQFGNTLNVAVLETDFNPNFNLNDYRARLPLNGDFIQSGLTVSLTQGTSDLNPNQYFTLESVNNVGIYIRLTNALDRDGGADGIPPPRNSVTYGLTCTFQGNPTQYTLVITLTDVNDNDPVLLNLPTVQQVNELTYPGLTIYTVTANDKDLVSSGNGRVTYSITSGNGINKFNIDSATGRIFLNEQLDFETTSFYSLTIKAEDNGAIPRSRSAFFNVSVNDGNDNSAAFISNNCQVDSRGFCVGAEYSATIVSGSQTGNLILSPFNIRARDKDTLGAPIEFSIFRTNPSGYEGSFSVGPSTQVFDGTQGNVYTAVVSQNGIIDRSNLASTKGSITITVVAREATVPNYQSYAYIDVFVTTANQFAPTLSPVSGTTFGSISENARSGDFVRTQSFSGNFLQLRINDQDFFSNEVLSFSSYQISTNQPSQFSVTSDGFIQLASANLDFETTTINPFNLEVVIRDSGVNPRSSTLTLTINVIDVNDNTPLFPTQAYQATFPEGTYTFNQFTNNRPRDLVTVSATDADISSQFRQITYSIAAVSENATNLFTINQNTGLVQADGTFVGPKVYTLTIQASDGERSSRTALIVTVTDVVGQSAPQFPASTVNIVVSEGSLSGASVYQANAVDEDQQLLSYSMTQINQVQQFPDFIITTSGEVQVRLSGSQGVSTGVKVLDRETRSSYVYIVRAGDTSGQSATMTLSITLSDINDNNPFFTNAPYLFSVTENENSPIVGTVTATDNDQAGTVNSQITYRLPNINNRFTINANTGQISVIGSLDYETQSQYAFIVEAVDSASDSRTGTASVSIRVIDIQDNVPLFVETSVTVTVAESATIGTTIVRVTALDRDSVSNIQYVLSGTNSQDFSVQNFNGVANIITRQTYNLFLTTQDGQNSNIAGASASIFITVLNVNEFSPVLTLPSTSINIVETIPLGSTLAQVTATDLDNPTNQLSLGITYSIISVTPNSGTNLFSIHPENGRIYLVGFLRDDQTRPNQYTLNIQARDNDVNPRTDTKTLTVNIVRNQGPPIFSQSGNYFQTVDETLGVFSSVLTVTATDSDSNTDPVRYSLSFSDIGAYFFSVDATSGLLSVRQALTLDDDLSYTVRIIATDTGGLSSTATAQISVNRNLNTPTWSQTTYTQTINENYPLFTSILRVQATDLDTQAPFNTLTYTIFSNNANNFFTFTSTGVLQLTNTLISTSGNFTFQVSLRDNGLPQPRSAIQQATVTIIVNRNAFAPLFFNSTYYTTILESAPVGTSVMTVSAQDQDVRVIATDNGTPARSAAAVVIVDIRRNFNPPSWQQRNYAIAVQETQALGVPFQVVSAIDGDSQPPHNTVYYRLRSATFNTGSGLVDALAYFQMNSASSGQISLRQSLVNEVARPSQYTLTVEAYDGGTPVLTATDFATVSVTVLRNNNPPVFFNTPYSTTISRNQATGQSIYAVFGEVRYEIVGLNTAPNYFAVDAVTGVISLSQSVAQDTTTTYTLVVQAYDSGSPMLRNTQPPTFSQQNYQITIFETQVL